MSSVEREILSIIEDKGMVSIKEVSDEIGLSKETTKRYLFKMVSDGVLKFRKVGNMFIFEKA